MPPVPECDMPPLLIVLPLYLQLFSSGEESRSGLELKQFPAWKLGSPVRSGTAELGEGGSNRKELDEKLPTNVSDLTASWPEGGMGHQGQAEGITNPCSGAWLHMEEAKSISMAWGENGLLVLKGKQTGDLNQILWPSWRVATLLLSTPSTEVLVSGEGMTLSPHRMKKASFSPGRQHLIDLQQTL
ncbi:hypothetical protein BTVI_138479 [Pitangus sulphuratus]|nr:hypothetical protein BTVI_138479 [Pitangus sulphuratus]